MKITNQRLLPAALFVSALQMSPQPPSEAKTKASIPPRFEDYRVSEVFNGQPSPPILATPEQRMFRTRITDGVSKGWGVLRDGREGSTPGPNFAGHYIAIQWGCGMIADKWQLLMEAPDSFIPHRSEEKERDGLISIIRPDSYTRLSFKLTVNS